jgi:hypothetical protein
LTFIYENYRYEKYRKKRNKTDKVKLSFDLEDGDEEQEDVVVVTKKENPKQIEINDDEIEDEENNDCMKLFS